MTNNSILLTIIGALVALGLRELLGIWRRPKIELDFEEYSGKKPYIHQMTLIDIPSLPKAKYMRLIVKNKGQRPAENCEAKLEVFIDRKLDPLIPNLHWSRRDPGIFKELDEIFKPITINRKAKEALDVIRLIQGWEKIESVSPRVYLFESKRKYLLKVTVFSSNADPEEKEINLFWDGTWENFDKSIS